MGETPQQENEEQIPQNKPFIILGEQMNIGDNAYAIRSSDGKIEKDWKLISAKPGFKVVIEKFEEEADPKTGEKKYERKIKPTHAKNLKNCKLC